MLILGGSTEASALAAALAGRVDVAAVLSLAGRVREPAPQPLPLRVGGFGGIDGLANYLRTREIAVVVDATHPFAATISHNARLAAAEVGVPLLDAVRAGWRPEAGDRWREVAGMAEAAAALGPEPRRVFLTVGRLQLAAFAAAPQHHYLVRSIDPVGPGHGLGDAVFVAARGPFAVEAEAALMERHGIEVLVTKNSGGTASAAKIVAARRLGLAVVLVRPPGQAGGMDVPAVLDAIDRLVKAARDHAAPPLPAVGPERRGV